MISKTRVLSFGIVLLFCLLPLGVVLADVYTATITIQDTSTSSRDIVPVLVPANISQMVSEGFLDSSGRDSRVFEGENELTFGLANDKLMFLVNNLEGSQERLLRYNTGETPFVDTLWVITGTGGYITRADHANLELGNSFSLDLICAVSPEEGWLLRKNYAFGIYKDAMTLSAGFLAAEGLATTRTLTNAGGFTNGAYAIDGDTGTSATKSMSGVGWTGTLEAAIEPVSTSQIYTSISCGVTGAHKINVDVYDEGTDSWIDVFSGNPNGGTSFYSWAGYKSIPGGPLIVSSIRMQIYFADSGGGTAAMKELNVDSLESIMSTPSVSTTLPEGEEVDILVSADTTNLYLYVDSSLEDSTALGGSVTNNAESWVLAESVEGFKSYSHTTSGTLRLEYEPTSLISGTTLPDASGNGLTGTITWGSNDSIDLTLGAFTSLEEFLASTGDEEVIPDIFGIPSIPNTETPEEAELVDLPAYTIFRDTAASLGWSTVVLYGTAYFILSGAMLFAVMVATGSLLLGGLGAAVLLGVGSSSGVIDGWVPFAVAAVVILIAYLSRNI